MENLIKKLEQSGLNGRSGSCFPTWKKWQIVKDVEAEKKYVLCNASEGEPDVFKDKYILERWPDEVINGIKLALETLGADSAYIHINKDYYNDFKKSLTSRIQNLPIELSKKAGGYLAGEETSIIETIEGNRPEPRIKPPFPTEKGLWQRPTLINNLETFYYVSKIAEGKYDKKRFYCISGEVENQGVFELPENATIGEILKETDNLPRFNFFVQAGGGASGEILLETEIDQAVKGIGAIIVHNKEKTNPVYLMQKWAEFFLKENCDKCAPCREGMFRINEIVKQDKIDKELLAELFETMEKSSLCPLGRIATAPFKTTIEKLL